MTLHGPDGSHWQDGLVVPASDWDSVHFVLWRSSIGTRSDASFRAMRDAALAHGKAFCAYHFVYPTGRYTAAAQAETFHRQVGDVRIPCMLDWESDGSLAPTWDDVLKVAEAIRLTGHAVPLVYTGKWYWQMKGSPTMSGHGMDMVNAHYGSNPRGTVASVYAQRGGDGCVGWRGYGGLEPVVLQYGSRVSFGSIGRIAGARAAAGEPPPELDPARPPRVEPGRKRGAVRSLWYRLTAGSGVAMDMNAYRGDRADLRQWFYDPAYVPPKPKPEPKPEPIPNPGDDDMAAVLIAPSDTQKQDTFWWNASIGKVGWVPNGAAMRTGIMTKAYVADDDGGPVRTMTKAEIQQLINSQWDRSSQLPPASSGWHAPT